MNTQNPKSARTTITVLSLLCIILAGGTIYSLSQLRDLESAQADMQKKLDAEAKEAKDLAADAAHWRKQRDNLLGQNSNASKPADADKSASKRILSQDELKTLVKNPMMQSMIASQQSAAIAMTYSAMLDHFKLAPEERDYLQKLLVDKQMVQVNLGMQMMNASMSPEDRAALGQQIGQGMADDDAKIKTFLNDDKDYAYYQTYTQQEPERLEVGMLQTSLGDNALSADQSEALANLLSDSRNSYPFTVNFYDHRNFGNPGVINSTSINKFLDEQTQFQASLVEKAAGLLTPAQLEAFKQNQANVRQMTRMQMNSIQQLTGSGQ